MLKRLFAFLMCLMLTLPLLSFAEEETYETALFGTDDIITLDILMDADTWREMLDTATKEEYYVCNVVVNGTLFENVGIRPKGNTSLTSIAADPDCDRYSFKIEFDHYIKGQTCFGLDKLILNNNYADATNMKEALIYDMYRYMGADASLYNYCKISVNGEYFGIYLALEGVEDSFQKRVFGNKKGELYKPDSLDFGDRADMSFDKDSIPGDFDTSNFTMPSGFGPGNTTGGTADTSTSATVKTDNNTATAAPDSNAASAGGQNSNTASFGGQSDNTASFGGQNSTASFGGQSSSVPTDGETPAKPENGGDFMKGGFNFGSMFGGSGANLNYTDDDPDSYSSIWDGSVTKTNDEDHERVITALRNIFSATDLETYMDVDNLLRYMAVHIFSVNSDSLSGMMAHNYYLYEDNGQLNIIPWDYNLSLGGMGGMGGGSAGGASSVVNSPIDDAFNGTNFFDTLMEDDTYYEQYHENLRILVDEYINGGAFDAFYTRARAILDEYVPTDPNAFFTYDEYAAAADTLYQVVKLRGESISGQLNGTIPSTQAGQTNVSTLIDCTGINISLMGSMNSGDAMKTWMDENAGEGDTTQQTETTTIPGGFTPDSSAQPGEMPSMPGNMPSGSMPANGFGQPPVN